MSASFLAARARARVAAEPARTMLNLFGYKRMDGTFDVQRDHAALLDDALAVCNGAVWFSTNLRRFKLELTDPSLAVADMTHATIPLDFRDPRVHHALRIARG